MKLKITFNNIKNIETNMYIANKIVEDNEISFFCETWLPENKEYVLKEIRREYTIINKSEIETCPIKGRPYGGMCWFLKPEIQMIDYNFINKHVSFIVIQISEIKILIIGVYMPYDNGRRETKHEYDSNLHLVEQIIYSFRYAGVPNVILGGDFNVDLNKRKKKLTKMLQSFVDNNKFILCDTLFTQRVDNTFENHNSTSNIDHILMNEQISRKSYMIQCNIIADVMNLSDHKQLQLIIDLNVSSSEIGEVNDQANQKGTINKTIRTTPDLLDQEVKELYHTAIDIKLKNYIRSDSTVILNDHEKIDNLYKTINKTIKETYDEMTIMKSIKLKDNVWWTKELRDIKAEILAKKKKMKVRTTFKNNMDYDDDDDNDNMNKNEIKNLKRNFRRIMRRNKRNTELKNMKYIEKIASNSNKNKFWSKLRHYKNNNQEKQEIQININELERHYAKIFSEDSTLENEFQQTVNEEVITFEKQNKLNNVNKILFSRSDVESALKQSSNSKSIGNDEINPFLLKHSGSKLMINIIMELFNNILNSGYFPENFNMCLIKPILKNKSKSNKDIDNVRPIAISNSLAQLFERIILNKNYDKFNTHENQFGFKKKCSCKHAIYVMKETITRYIENKSACYLTALDAEKAFDRLWRQGLFHKIRNVLDPHTWLILKKYYDGNKAMIVNDNINSQIFEIKTGVKQGGILSPYLFNLFIDDLIQECTSANLGARIGDYNTSIINYCDDMNLLSPTGTHMQRLLDICTEYGYKWRIRFNVKKSQFMSFGETIIKNPKFELNKIKLAEADSLKILGYTFTKSLRYNENIIDNFSKVKKTFFSLYKFGMRKDGLNPYLQAFIYKTFCVSKITYALELMTIDKKTLNDINLNQNFLIRFMVGISKYSHISEVRSILKIQDFHHLYLSYKVNFMKQLNNNTLTRKIFEYLNQRTDLDKKSLSYSHEIKSIFRSYNTEFKMQNDKEIKIKFEDSFDNKKIEDVKKEIIKDCLDNINLDYNRKLLYLTIRIEIKEMNLDLMT